MHTQNQKRYVEVKMTLKGLAFVLKMEENVSVLQRQLSLKWKTSLNLLCTPVCMIYTKTPQKHYNGFVNLLVLVFTI